MVQGYPTVETSLRQCQSRARHSRGPFTHPRPERPPLRVSFPSSMLPGKVGSPVPVVEEGLSEGDVVSDEGSGVETRRHVVS